MYVRVHVCVCVCKCVQLKQGAFSNTVIFNLHVQCTKISDKSSR